jgi:predicted nucleic acid-binding protein
VASLVDTNVLVYRYDPRDPAKQRIAMTLLESGIRGGKLVLAHQSILEFVAVVTRPRRELGGDPMMSPTEAFREAEALIAQFPTIYPTREVLITAMRGCATYGLPWYDAHIWATAETHGLREIFSEDFQHGRHYGDVRAVNPFLSAADAIHELPPLYADARVTPS